MHVHVTSAEGEAKIWIEPEIEVDRCVGYDPSQVSEILNQVRDRRDEIKSRWKQHFG